MFSLYGYLAIFHSNKWRRVIKVCIGGLWLFIFNCFAELEPPKSIALMAIEAKVTKQIRNILKSRERLSTTS